MSGSIGSQDDMVRRLKAALPAGWFSGDENPVLDGLLAGLGYVWSSLWTLLAYVSKQTRIATATDVNLDIIGRDFLGTALARTVGETDDAYRARIQASLFQEMGTRRAITRALTSKTGAPPVIFEPRNASDTGGRSAVGSRAPAGLAYNTAGGYGSYSLPFQAFVTTNLPISVGVSGVQGYGARGVAAFGQVIGGYNAGAIEYASGSAGLLSASDQEVYDAVNAVKPVATIIWVSTSNTNPQTAGGGHPVLDVDFVLDVSRLS